MNRTHPRVPTLPTFPAQPDEPALPPQATAAALPAQANAPASPVQAASPDSSRGYDDATGWWRDPGALRRFTGDLLASEFARLRPGAAALPPPAQWPLDLPMDESGFGADSLERLALGAALAQAIHLHESALPDTLLGRPSFGAWVDVAAASLARFYARLTFRTSGSTGAPKPCTHALAALAEETAELARIIGPRARVLSAVPSHHIYGFLFTVLLPRRLGADPAVLDLRADTPARLAMLLRPGDLLVGHPDFWRAVVTAAPRLPADVVGITSTAPCPDDLAAAVRAAGVDRLIQVYGSSETAGLGWRDAPGAPYRLFPYWQRQDDGGPADAAHAADASAATARSPASADSVASASTASTACAPCVARRTADGQRQAFTLSDALHWHDATHFEVQGRRDQAVQVGGVNVFPAQVRAVLLTHPDVADAAVRPMNADEGHRLKAFIVPRAGAAAEPALRRALTAWLDARLTAPQRPRALNFGPRVPVDSLGKAADWPIA